GSALYELLQPTQRPVGLALGNAAHQHAVGRGAHWAERGPELVGVLEPGAAVAVGREVVGRVGARTGRAAALPHRAGGTAGRLDGPVHLDRHAPQVQRLLEGRSVL